MFGDRNKKQVTVVAADPAGTYDQAAALLYAENTITLEKISVQFIHSADLPSAADNYVTLNVYDGGDDASGTDDVAERGGSGTGWTKGEVYDLPLSATQIDAGHWLTYKYTEAGDVAFKAAVINVVYREHATA